MWFGVGLFVFPPPCANVKTSSYDHSGGELATLSCVKRGRRTVTLIRPNVDEAD